MTRKTNHKHMVIFQPSGRRGYVDEGITLKEASVALGVEIEGICGEKAICGKCKVRIEEGVFEKYGIESSREHLSLMGATERKFFNLQQERGGYRLACQTRVLGDIVIFISEESRLGKQVVRKEAKEIKIEVKPAIRKYYVEMKKATLEDTLGDWERLQAELREKFSLTNLTIDLQVLLSLQEVVRQDNWKVTVAIWQGKEVIKVEPGHVEISYGLAIDVGTTTLAGYLCNLTDGKVVATASMMNPQVIYGEDVMSRISYTMSHKDGLERLNKAILDGINGIAKESAAQAGTKRQDIVDMTIVGNTCMHHILLNIDPRYIGRSPFPPALHHSLDIKARDIGLNILPEVEAGKKSEAPRSTDVRDLGIKISPGAYVHILPIEAGFVGADNVAVLIAEAPYKQPGKELIIDIGTNGELVLGNQQKLISCSCATGPAFEGAEIKHGMRAAPGAIEKIEIDKVTKEVRFKVIGKEDWHTDLEDVKAKGICGSGIIDAVPQMFMAGIIDHTGRFKKDFESRRFRINKGQPEFVIAWANETFIGQDIIVCQDDVRNIQLAKAAMYTGAKIMMRHLGIDNLDKVILTGAFGSYINKESAACLGLFPDCALEKVYAVGNAAGDGARIVLLDVDKRTEADKVARQVEYVELTVEADFDKFFGQAMWLPHMKDTFPHLNHLLYERVVKEA
ncbi:MAG: ASKHA domain-containing protein [Dehalococcoidales bacterium]|jgi:uncharacterized 2Fe-2S/4Fe-4S cluster protein (DUF4445 family)|nr:ASKHA domain-containing protein [Dehalococcoidales bacterium]